MHIIYHLCFFIIGWLQKFMFYFINRSSLKFLLCSCLFYKQIVYIFYNHTTHCYLHVKLMLKIFFELICVQGQYSKWKMKYYIFVMLWYISLRNEWVLGECSTKNIQDFYLDRDLTLWAVKKWFCRFCNAYFPLNNKIRSGRTSGIDNDLVWDLVNNNPRITTEEITEKLYVDKSTAFPHIKQLGYVSKLDASEIRQELLQSPQSLVNMCYYCLIVCHSQPCKFRHVRYFPQKRFGQYAIVNFPFAWRNHESILF